MTLRARGLRRRCVGLSCAVALCLLARPVGGDQDPRWRWRTIETEHFQVHFPSHLRTVARRVAVLAEETHERLTADLGWEPRRTAHWVVVDDTDYAQGISYTGPNNVIRIWAVSPEDGASLEDYDDWLREVITHEYTHLVHMDQVRGLPALVNAIFGHVYFPNQLAPLWILEGFAIHEESSQSSGGRARGSMFDMFLRAQALEGELLRIDEISSGSRRFPHGSIPYLYGQGFVTYLVRRFGSGFPRALAREMGDELIPWSVNRSFSRVTADRSFRRASGFGAIELYRDWQRSLEAGYRALAERLAEEGLTESRQFTRSGEWMRSPRWSPDGRHVYYYGTGEDSPAAIFSLDVESGRRRRLFVTSGSTALAATRDGRSLYYSRGDRHWVTYQYEDLFRFDLRTGEEVRLTDGARAREPDASPDGRSIVFAANRTDSSDLWMMGADGGDRRRLVESAAGEQVYTPRWSPDGRRVAISRWHAGGYRDIELLDLASGRITRITEDRAVDTNPSFSPDGRWLLFASDRTGVPNLYAWDLDQAALRQVTNVVTGAFMPEVSPDGDQLAFAGFSAAGFDLHVMPFDPGSFRDPQPVREREPFDRPAPEVRTRERAYEPWATLAPRAWLVGWGPDAFAGAQAITLSTWGLDATEAHRFAGTLAVGLGRGDVTYDVGYELALFRPNLSFRTSRWVAPRRSFRMDTSSVDFVEEGYLASADLSIYLGSGNYAHRLSAGWEVRYTLSAGGLPQVDPDPSGRPPRFPLLGLQTGISLSWRFSNARGVVRGVSLEEGRSLSASMSLYHPALGSDWFQLTFRYRWTEYLLMPWLRHHVLALSLGGGISAGELRTDAFFIGGYTEQGLVDVLMAAIQQQYQGGNPLRGYPAGSIGGAQYHVLNVEYRFPIWDIEWGPYTLPLFLSNVWGAVFCDAGGAFGDTFDVEALRVGVGGEILLRIVVGYRLPLTFRIGYARGLMEGGADQFFGVLGMPY